ncbi:Uncharacterised protein [Weissella viridescens]|uniref:Uncharacterized protein n=1 Tax=Weissella viridescens TaxID=1629 RepID=A0A380P9C6_WEIVI|nr:Uncharacterised protein [Weissella viridescens]
MPNLENTSSESIELYFSVLEYIPSVIRGEKLMLELHFIFLLKKLLNL